MRIVWLLVAVGVVVGCSSAPAPADGGGAGGGGTGGGAVSDAGSGGGTGGGTADAGVTCSELSTSYAREFPATRACHPASLINECTAFREKILGCGCKTYVAANSVAKIDAISAQFSAKSCTAPTCPLSPCPNATGGSCLPTDASSEGLCQDTF